MNAYEIHLGLFEIGFIVDKIYHRYIFNNYLIKLGDTSYYFYEIITDKQMLISDSIKMNYRYLDEKIVKLINVFELNSDTIIKDIKTYIRISKIYKLVKSKDVPRCPRCFHNFYHGGYGICRWCLYELNRDNVCY